jgi:hypothetical protein
MDILQTPDFSHLQYILRDKVYFFNMPCDAILQLRHMLWTN